MAVERRADLMSLRISIESLKMRMEERMKEAIEMMLPGMPKRYRGSIQMRGSMRKWKRGSHTPPSWASPGVRPSITCLAI